jgi:hypothetical protein
MLLHFFYRHLHVYPSHKVERAAGAASKKQLRRITTESDTVQKFFQYPQWLPPPVV